MDDVERARPTSEPAGGLCGSGRNAVCLLPGKEMRLDSFGNPIQTGHSFYRVFTVWRLPVSMPKSSIAGGKWRGRLLAGRHYGPELS